MWVGTGGLVGGWVGGVGGWLYTHKHKHTHTNAAGVAVERDAQASGPASLGEGDLWCSQFFAGDGAEEEGGACQRERERERERGRERDGAEEEGGACLNRKL